MTKRETITAKYDHILELLEKSPGNEEALDALIDLEESVKDHLFDILQDKHGVNWEQSNVFSKFGKGNRDRDSLESIIINKITGKKLSINDFTDMFIKKINDILAMPINNQEKIKLLNIQYLKIKETILPPDYDKTPITGSGTGWVEKGKDYDKFSLLIQLLRETGIYTDDILAIEGTNTKNMMRKDSYVCLYIPRINKTVFINNNYGEATFIYDGILDIERFIKFGKEGLKSDLNKIIFSEKYIDAWKKEILQALFSQSNIMVGKKKNIKDIKISIEENYKRIEFIDFYNQLSEEDKKTIIIGHQSYQKRAKNHPNIPNHYDGLISLLGGNIKCRQGGYVKALIEGNGDKYFEKWEIDKNKTPEQKKQEFIDFYNRLSEEDKQMIITSAYTYRRLAKHHHNIPNTYKGLTSLLGGDIKCQGGGYIKTLIEGNGDQYFEKWQIDKNKTSEQKKQEFVDFYNQLSKEDKNMIISGDKSYQELTKHHPNIPNTYYGLISLLGGNIKCIQGGYVKALIEGNGDKYFENRENANNKKIKTKQEFIDFYNRLSKKDKNMIIGNGMTYSKRAKKYPNIPNTYYGLVSLLGGDIKCIQGGYIKALIEGNGEAYFKKWQIDKNKTPEQKKQEFVYFYNQLSEDKQKMVVSNAYTYEKLAKHYPNIPNSYKGLISLLGGDIKCAKGGYIKALIEGNGDKYFENRENANNKKIKTKQEFIDFYNRLSEKEKDKNMIIGNGMTYSKRAKKYPNIPNSYKGLISLLGGDIKCMQGGYVKTLIEGNGEVYFKEWKIDKNKTPEQKKQEFVDFYNRLSEEDKQMIVSSTDIYSKRAKNYPNIPNSYNGLISLLGGDIKCMQGGYIKALIEGNGEVYFKEWKNNKEK